MAERGAKGTAIGLFIGLVIGVGLYFDFGSFWLALYVFVAILDLCRNLAGKFFEEQKTLSNFFYAIMPVMVGVPIFVLTYLLSGMAWLAFLVAFVAEGILGQALRMLIFPAKERRYYHEMRTGGALTQNMAAAFAPPGMERGVAAGLAAIGAYNAGNEYYRCQEFSEAVDCYGQAIAHASRDPNADLLRVPDMYYNRALAYAALQQSDKAFADLETTISIDPKYAESSYRERIEANFRISSEHRE